jgi:UDP-GlcNAc:undecaprenyl-phosphate GlcNAc-1-phosphate transferase
MTYGTTVTDFMLSPNEMKTRHVGLFLVMGLVWGVGRRLDGKQFPHYYLIACLMMGGLVLMGFGFRVPTFQIGQTVFQLEWLSIPVTLLWLLVMAEFFRLFDGLDGLLALSCLAAVIHRFYFLHPLEQYTATLCLCLVPPLIGVLPWTLYPARMEFRGISACLPGFFLGAITLVGREKASTTKLLLFPSLVVILVLSIFCLWLLEQHLFLPSRHKPSEQKKE